MRVLQFCSFFLAFFCTNFVIFFNCPLPTSELHRFRMPGSICRRFLSLLSDCKSALVSLVGLFNRCRSHACVGVPQISKNVIKSTHSYRRISKRYTLHWVIPDRKKASASSRVFFVLTMRH